MMSSTVMSNVKNSRRNENELMNDFGKAKTSLVKFLHRFPTTFNPFTKHLGANFRLIIFVYSLSVLLLIFSSVKFWNASVPQKIYFTRLSIFSFIFLAKTLPKQKFELNSCMRLTCSKPKKKHWARVSRSEQRTSRDFILYSVVRDSRELKLYCVKLIKTAARCSSREGVTIKNDICFHKSNSFTIMAEKSLKVCV